MQGPDRLMQKKRPTKDRRHNTLPRYNFNIQQDNNAIVKNSGNEIILQENQKVSANKGAHENIESNIDEKKLYQIDDMSLEVTKETREWLKREFECEHENKYENEKQSGMTCGNDNKVKNISELNLLHDINQSS